MSRSRPDAARLLVLDLDGTLADTIEDLRAPANRLLEARGLAPLSPDEIRPMIGDGVAALVARALAARGAAPDQAATDSFLADYQAGAARATRLFPGIEAMLAAMQAAGWRFAVCTNKPVLAAGTLLEALGVSHQLAAIGGGDSFAVRKPDPGHLLGTIALAGGEAMRAVMVGDHGNDIAAAAGAGVASIFAGWGYGAPAMARGAGAVAATPDAVPALADRLLTARAR